MQCTDVYAHIVLATVILKKRIASERDTAIGIHSERALALALSQYVLTCTKSLLLSRVLEYIHSCDRVNCPHILMHESAACTLTHA